MPHVKKLLESAKNWLNLVPYSLRTLNIIMLKFTIFLVIWNYRYSEC